MQVEVEPFDKRAIKGLRIEAEENFTIINSTEIFELYVIRDDLHANPIVGNAKALREQADVCSLSISSYNADTIAWIDDIVNSVDPSDCSITVCPESQCTPKLGGTSDGDRVAILDYFNCTCDIVVGLDHDDKFFMHTVSYNDEDMTLENDITMFGLFEPYLNWSDDGPDGAKKVSTITINDPVNPAIVPRFNSLQDLADRMGQALTKVTGINTTITVAYNEGTSSEPGSFLFGIQFGKKLYKELSFSKTLSLGDFADLTVSNSELSIGGEVTLSTEMGVLFESDDTTGLKLVGSLKDNCTSGGTLKFIIRTTENDSTQQPQRTDVEVSNYNCNNPTERVDDMKTAINDAFGDDDVSVSLVGTSSVVLSFDPRFSTVTLDLDKKYKSNPFGFKNDMAKKAGFQFATGLTSAVASMSVSGEASAIAKVVR